MSTMKDWDEATMGRLLELREEDERERKRERANARFEGRSTRRLERELAQMGWDEEGSREWIESLVDGFDEGADDWEK